MDRLFWVECPECQTRWYAEWELRDSDCRLECPKPGCGHKFRADEASWIDDRDPPPS